jgi:NADPH:quinone reductase-like Zn-dependent oxidoreductase
MGRLVLRAFGDPAQALSLEPDPDLEPGSDEVLVAIEAATINPSDINLVKGAYGVRPDLPSGVGVEGVGRVIATGDGVDSSLMGGRVMIVPNYEQGTWADRVVVGARNVVAVSDDADPLQLAMAAINPATAYGLLHRYESLEAGDWIAHTAANSAVGQYIVALAREAGIKTLSIVRRPAAAEQVRALGGDRVLVPGEDFHAQIAQALDGAELKLVIDGLGGGTVEELAHFLAFGKTVLSYSIMSGRLPVVGLRDLIYREVALRGFWIVNWIRNAPRSEIEETYRTIAKLVAKGIVSASVEATYGLGDFRQAFDHAQRKERTGKILFAMDGESP